ncbi:MAG: hypothetical protein LBV72_06585 [Tannerella sp.]|jgi:hypothetical protein|nr:hypothetical protein [Tannerella sp.]
MLKFDINIGKKKRDLLEKLDKAGCVMQTIIFRVPYMPDDLYAASKQAAIEGMIYFNQQEYLQILSSIKNDKLQSDKTLYPPVITGEPKGKRINFYEFIGTQKIVNNETINLFGKVFDAYMSEFIYALLSPPYSMRFDKEYFPEIEGNKKEYVLNKYINEILDIKTIKDIDRLVIYKWSEDWSDFFKEGKEWWGCYFWTVYNPITNNITVLGASTTD